MRVFFASDLHGDRQRYRSLFAMLVADPPPMVCLGGDLLPREGADSFVDSVLAAGFATLRHSLGDFYPRVCLIAGNDDPRVLETRLLRWEEAGLWHCLNGRSVAFGGLTVYGYPYVPPTPFLLKDWERYDVSHYVDPGCESPEGGVRTVEVAEHEARYATIERDLEALAGEDDVSGALFLFHTPPYQTALDRAALDGRSFDHVPLDVHVGSIAVRRFIEKRQPRVTLHGHVHESARLTGRFSDRIGQTVLLGAAHDGPELALVRFDTDAPEGATRVLL